MIQRRPTLVVVAAAALALVTPTAPANAQSPGSAHLSASQTVRVKLKKSWRVTKAKQLKVKDGSMTCNVTKLVRKKKKPARAAVLRCTLPSGAVAGTTFRLTISVKGKKGAKVSKRVVVLPRSTPPGPGPGTPPPGDSKPTTSAGPITRVNADANGNGGNQEAGSATWSPDGTKVAFYSRATNLVPGVSDGCPHVYLKTLATGAIRVVDTAADNTLGNGCPSGPGINSGLGFSPQGDWLLFCSSSSNIINGAPLHDEDVMGKNLNSGAVEWFGPGCGWPTWSPDGTKIAYATDYEGCPGLQNNGAYDVVWIDRNSDLMSCLDFHRASSDSAGNQQTWNGPMDSTRPMWSPDSTRILFESLSPFLVPNDTNVSTDLFVKSINTNAITRVSTNSQGGQLSGFSERGAWSPDGTRIAFDSKANDVVAGDTNVHEDIFVKNLGDGAVTMVSTNGAGQPTLWPHRNPSWSPDGNSIAWDSEAVDLVPNDANTRRDVFTKTLNTGFVQLVSSNANGIQGDSTSSAFGSAPRAWSPDGTRVLFTSNAQNLAPNDGNAFNEDVYVKTP